MHKITSLFLFHLLFSLQTSAQKAPEWLKTQFAVGYYGNLATNPGLAARFEYGFYEKIKNKTKAKRGKSVMKYKTNRLEIAPEIGFFYDRKSSFNTFSHINLQYKRINHHHWLFVPSVGFGGLISFIPNVYDAGSNFEFKKVASNAYWCPKIGLEVGRLSPTQKGVKGLYLSISSQFLVNYNGGTVPLPAIEIGRRF